MTSESQSGKKSARSAEGWRLMRILILLAVCVVGARYVLGLSTLVAIFGGATVACITAVLINRVLSRDNQDKGDVESFGTRAIKLVTKRRHAKELE
jgi:membrane-associated phospholipid phosphatase